MAMKLSNHTAVLQGHRRSWRDHSLLLQRAPAAMLWLLFAASNVLGQQKPTEYQVKTVYLYNFARFVEWPRNPDTKNDTFAICVLGQDPFGPSLDTTLAGEIIDRKRVAARRISDAKDAASCNVLFISSSEEPRLKTTLSTLDRTPVLTVSDIPQFSQRGGMIQFVLEGNRVRFEVNLTAAQNAGLTLSSELLKVATAVRGAAPRGD